MATCDAYWPILTGDGREHFLVQLVLQFRDHEPEFFFRHAETEEEVAKIVEGFEARARDEGRRLRFRIFKYFAREYELIVTKSIELREV